MAYDDPTPPSLVLPGLRDLLREAAGAAEAFAASARAAVGAKVAAGGRKTMDAEQHVVHGYAWVATYAELFRQVAAWADRLDADVRVSNDADMAARAEMRVRALAGMGERATNLFYIAGQVGIGGALLVDGSIVSGQHGWGGELGHTTVDPAGPRCACAPTTGST